MYNFQYLKIIPRSRNFKNHDIVAKYFYLDNELLPESVEWKMDSDPIYFLEHSNK